MKWKIYFIIVITNLLLSIISFKGVIIGNVSYLVYRSIIKNNE